MPEFLIRQAMPWDIPRLAPLLRQEHVAEVMASDGATPAEALEFSYDLSEKPMTVVIDGVPAAMFGMAPDPERERCGSLWMLGSHALERHSHWFLRSCLTAIQPLVVDLDYGYSLVDARYGPALAWLEWLGFVPAGHDPAYGHERRPFVLMLLKVGHGRLFSKPTRRVQG